MITTLLLAALLQDPQEPAAAPRGPMPIPIAFACRRGDRPIQIDGSLVDWPELPAINLSDPRQLSGTADGAWRGADDLSAFAFLMWDQDDLYFAATVRDEWHRALDPKTIQLNETPIADAIVLTFDPKRDTRSLGPDPGRADDTELWLSAEDSHEVLRWDRLRGAAGIVEGGRLVVGHDVQESITTYELRVPWSAVLASGALPEPGTVFDLQIVVNDFDETTDHMPQTRIGWTFGCGPLADPALCGSVVLLAETEAQAESLPTVPERPAVAEDSRLLPPFLEGLAADLVANPPAVHDGSTPPAAVGGSRRGDALDRLDYEIGRYPRVDFVEYCQRQQRRMTREVAAAQQRGLPLFWLIRERMLARTLSTPPPPTHWRLARLPQGGWLVQGERQAFLVDPAGSLGLLWRASDFVLLTQPLDMTRRNEQLFLRMHDARPERPVLTHIAFHLPRLLMSDMPLIEPGADLLQSNGVRIGAIGDRRDDGKVLFAMAYRADLPGGVRILFAGPAMSVDQLPTGHCDVLVLTPRNQQAVALANALKPDLVVVDDTFLCSQLPNVARVDLRSARQLQQEIAPLPSVLLAPGETWEISPQ